MNNKISVLALNAAALKNLERASGGTGRSEAESRGGVIPRLANGKFLADRSHAREFCYFCGQK